MAEQHSQDHDCDRHSEVPPSSLQKLDWWITSGHPLVELHDLAAPELQADHRSPVNPEIVQSGHHLPFSRDMQELKQYTWAHHEEWNKRMLLELKKEGTREDLHKLNVLVQLSTVGICLTTKYEVDGKEIALDYSQTNGVPYTPLRFRLAGERDPDDDWAAVDLSPGVPPRPEKPCMDETSWEVKTADAIDEVLKLQREGVDPVLLIMTDVEQPGGGYRHGTLGVEEEVCRRTDYCFSVDEDLKLQLKDPNAKPENASYPQGLFGAIYSKQVVFRHGAEQGYQLMPQTAVLPLAAVGAGRREEGQELEPLMQAERLELFKKLLLTCEVARRRGHRELVLALPPGGRALGPASDVAAVLCAVLSCFPGCFGRAVLALGEAADPAPFAAALGEPGGAPPPPCARGAGTSRLCEALRAAGGPRLCPHGSRCPNFLDRGHCGRWVHPFRAPCPRGHLCRVDPEADARHWRLFAHVCPEGERCALLQARDPEHLAAFVHPDLSLLPGRAEGGQRRARPDGQRCRASSNTDGREAEPYLGQQARRELDNAPRCPYKGINGDTDFAENQRYLSENLAAAGLELQEKDVAEVEAWISRLRPTHRCKLETFQSMLRLGAMVSTGIIDDIHQHGHEVVVRIAQELAERNPVCQRELQRHEGRGHGCAEQLKKYVRKVAVTQYYTKAGIHQDPSQKSIGRHIEDLEYIKGSLAGLGVEEASLLAAGNAAEQAARACHEIKTSDYIGIGYSVDRHLNSHRSIFALLGPHTGQYYGHICLVLKRDLLFHADSHLLANSATAINSGEAHNNRPWCPANPKAVARDQSCQQCLSMGFDCCEFKDENKKVFERSKLHACIHGWQRLLAQEMLGQAKHLNYEASLKGVQKMWYDKDSHAVIEAHLPSLIHFGYVEKIVMTKEQRGNLTERDLEVLRELFPEWSPLELRELPRDDRHIFKPAFDQTKDLAEAPHPELDRIGLCITLPPCNFDNRKIFPLPLSLHPSEGSRTQHLALKVNKETSFCLVLAASARHLRDYRSAKEAEFVTIMVVTSGSTSTHGPRSHLFMGGCLPKNPDMIFDLARRPEYKARGMCYVPDFDDAVCEEDGYRSYYLRVDSSGQVLFGHYGADTLLNRKAGLYPDPPLAAGSPLGRRVHVGVLTLNKPVSLADVVVRASPPEMALSPETLVELARTPEGLRHLHVPMDDGGDSSVAPLPCAPSSPRLAPRSLSNSLTFLGRQDQAAAANKQRRSSLFSWLSSPFRASLRASQAGPPTTGALPPALPGRDPAQAEEPAAPAPEQPQPEAPESHRRAQGADPMESPSDGTESCGASPAAGGPSDDGSSAQSGRAAACLAAEAHARKEEHGEEAAPVCPAAAGAGARPPWPSELQLSVLEEVEPPQVSTPAPSLGPGEAPLPARAPAPGAGSGASGAAEEGPGHHRQEPPAQAARPAPPPEAASRALPLQAASQAPSPEAAGPASQAGAASPAASPPSPPRAASPVSPSRAASPTSPPQAASPTPGRAEQGPPAREQTRPLEAITAAPDPWHSELLIHKEALPQMVMVAPDPATSEIFVHRQILPRAILASPVESQAFKMSL